MLGKTQKVLVTGADGFIGSHLCEELVTRGYHVKALVQYNSFGSWGWLDTSPKALRDQIEVVLGDIRDPFGMRKMLQGCDAVMHLAALIAIPYSYQNPASYIETNVLGSLNIFEAAKDLHISKIIHTSTSEVYGTARYVPIDEQHPLQGQSPYSASKIGADQVALSYHCSFNLPLTIIRPFNTYGPRQSNRAIIPTVITQIAAGYRELKLGAIHPTRDFSFVKDTARGMIACLESSQGHGEVINLGSNFEISIGDTAQYIAELMGTKMHITTDQDRLRPEKSEVERLWSNNTKAKQLLGWEPEYKGLEGFKKGLSETIDWFQNPQNLARYKEGLYNV